MKIRIILLTLIVIFSISGCTLNSNNFRGELSDKMLFQGESENWIGSVVVEQHSPNNKTFDRIENFELKYKGEKPREIEYVQFYINTLDEGSSKLGYNSPFNADGLIKGTKSCGGCKERKSSDHYVAVLTWKGAHGIQGEIFKLTYLEK